MVEGGEVKAFGLAVADGHVPGIKQAVVISGVFEVNNQLGVIFAQKMMQNRDVRVVAPADRQQYPMVAYLHEFRAGRNRIEVRVHAEDHIVRLVRFEFPRPRFGTFVFLNNPVPAAAFDPVECRCR